MSRRQPNKRIEAPGTWRAYLVLAGFAVFALVLAGRAFQLQVLNHEFLIDQGQLRYLATLKVPARRGAILDRNGEPLALSAPTKTIWAVPSELLAAPEKLAAVARHLKYTVSELRNYLQEHRNRQFLYLQRQLNPAHARRVMALDAPGVFVKLEYKRYYPAGEAAAQLIGLTDIDNRGISGMELALNKVLSGEPGSRQVIMNAKGEVVEDLAGFEPPEPGQNVRLTIDLRLQMLAYRELKEAVIEHEASSGVVVMVQPESGHILAMASYPSYNPNNRSTIRPEALRNRAATDIFEPGSSVKPLVVAAALDAGVVNRHTVIPTDGAFRLEGAVIHDTHDYGPVDMHRLLTKSSNIGAAKVGLMLGAETLWRYYYNFGFGQPTGVQFPGEQLGILRSYATWGKLETATAAFGYGIAVTALQLVRAYTAIATDGRIRYLQLVMGEAAGPQFPPQRVISAEVAKRVRYLMRDVVSEKGTAELAAVAGYDVIGKTGTTEQATADGYSEALHQAVFIGMAPADDPKLLTLVVIDDPREGGYFGGLAAAPVFSDIMKVALRMLRIPPETSKRVTVDVGPPSGEPA